MTWVAGGAAIALPLVGAAPALAHHVADLSTLQPTVANGILSGLAHPILGPDHLLFLLALSLVGLQHRLRWSLSLLVVGLLGSAAGLLWTGLPGAEPLVAATLVIEALVLLGRLPVLLLLPAMALHGYVLSGPVFGWTTMPVAAYALGLFIAQASLLLVALVLLRPLVSRLPAAGLRWIALALMACGGSWALAGLVA
ncbi:MAG: HupE/UreJ family protein [Synechococcus sp.]|nr:HupE/UreJ family protein [Synechococcus sp.]